MYKKCKIYFISIITLLTLNSCVTIETYIDDDRSDYKVFPITIKNRLIFWTDYLLDNYKLSYTGDVEYEGSNGKIETSEYIFHENNIEVCKLEVTETTRNGFLIFVSYEKHIKFIYANGINNEYKINTLNNIYPEESYLVYQNDSNGTIIVNKHYGAINKDSMEYIPNYHTGYDILVNNERYGILALEPKSFYLKTNNKIERKMALYILATLVSKEQ